MSIFGPSNLPPIDPFWGPKPVVGNLVHIDFGDSINAHPEIRGVVEYISDEHITVAYGHTTKRFRIDKCVHIEVIEIDWTPEHRQFHIDHGMPLRFYGACGRCSRGEY